MRTILLAALYPVRYIAWQFDDEPVAPLPAALHLSGRRPPQTPIHLSRSDPAS